jgi:serine/threonine-protein kinase
MQGRVFLGRYETIRLLGEGGMGRVYLAHQSDLGRQVVVKVMHDHIAADDTFRDRFERETLLTARFQHPYAVTVYDASLNDPQGPCIVMEYIRGVTLDTLLVNNRRLDPVRVGRLLHMLCECLFAAHSAGIVHRDLKPANLMIVDPDTPYEIVKVMDFGLAKLLGPDAKATVTNHEFAVGTPGYMCPEQAKGEEMDHRGDLYSVGVILFELLTGVLPFANRQTMDVLLAHATEEPPSFATVGAAGVVPAPIERVVQACLSKSPAGRPRHARELAELYKDAVAVWQEHEARRAMGNSPGPARTPRSRQGAPLATLPPSLVPTPPSAPMPTATGPSLAMLAANAPPPVAVAPEPVVVKSATPAPPPDPLAVVHHIEAWMPEKIATYKLRGFIQDVGGELLESIPGLIRVRLGTKNCVYKVPARGLSWLGLGRQPSIDVELRLHRPDNGKDNQLRITVIFRASCGTDMQTDSPWRAVCTQIFVDLRGYLMGQNGG